MARPEVRLAARLMEGGRQGMTATHAFGSVQDAARAVGALYGTPNTSPNSASLRPRPEPGLPDSGPRTGSTVTVVAVVPCEDAIKAPCCLARAWSQFPNHCHRGRPDTLPGGKCFHAGVVVAVEVCEVSVAGLARLKNRSSASRPGR